MNTTSPDPAEEIETTADDLHSHSLELRQRFTTSRIFELTTLVSFVTLVVFSLPVFNHPRTQSEFAFQHVELTRVIPFFTIATSAVAAILILGPRRPLIANHVVKAILVTALLLLPLRNPISISGEDIFGIPIPDFSQFFDHPVNLSNTIAINALLLPFIATRFESSIRRRFTASAFVLSILLLSIFYKVRFEELSAAGVGVSIALGTYFFWLLTFFSQSRGQIAHSGFSVGIVLTTLVHLPLFIFLTQAQSGIGIWLIYSTIIFSTLVFAGVFNRKVNSNEY